MRLSRKMFALAVFAGLTATAMGAGPAGNSPSTDNSGVDLVGIDHSVKPGDDFFSYANGTWVKHTQIPADRSSTGPTQDLEELTAQRTADLIRNMAKSHPAAGSNDRKIADYYAAFMDEAAIEKHGLASLQPELMPSRRAMTSRACWAVSYAPMWIPSTLPIFGLKTCSACS
jgi:putative endopeptidase